MVDGPGAIRSEHGSARATRVFPRELTSVAASRHWIRRVLVGHGAGEARCDDAELIVSELVTNALRHGLGEVVARVTVAGDEVQIAVTDSGAELPQLRAQRTDQIGGMGLYIVQRVAGAWGVAPFPGGKTVWATLSLR